MSLNMNLFSKPKHPDSSPKLLRWFSFIFYHFYLKNGTFYVFDIESQYNFNLEILNVVRTITHPNP